MSSHPDGLGASSADLGHYSNIEFKHSAFTVELLLVCLRTTSVSLTLKPSLELCSSSYQPCTKSFKVSDVVKARDQPYDKRQVGEVSRNDNYRAILLKTSHQTWPDMSQ